MASRLKNLTMDDTMNQKRAKVASRRSTIHGLPFENDRESPKGVQKLKDKGDVLEKSKLMTTPRNAIFSNEEESEICQIARIVWRKPLKMTKLSLRKIGYIYAKRTFKKCITNWVNTKLAGPAWCQSFIQRNRSLLPRLNSRRHQYFDTAAIYDAIEKFETKFKKKIGFVDKLSVSGTTKTMKKMTQAYNDVTVQSEMSIKLLQKELKSDRCDTPETAIVAMRKLQANCMTHARQLLKIANTDIVQVCTDSSAQAFESEQAKENLVQDETGVNTTPSGQLSIHAINQPSNPNDAMNDGINISSHVNGEKSQPIPTNFPTEPNDCATATNISTTELSDIDALLSQYEELLNEVELPIASNDCLADTVMTFDNLSPNEVETFFNQCEQGGLRVPSTGPSLTSLALESSTIVIDDDSDNDEIVFIGDLPMPTIDVETIDMECEGHFPMPIKNELVKKNLRRNVANCIKDEIEDIKTFDLVAGSMKFVNVTNANSLPDVYFPHVDVTITYSDYYLMFHLNKLQSNGQDGSSFDSNYVGHTLKSIFNVADILKMDKKIDFKNKKMEFAKDLFAVRANGDQKRLDTFEKYAGIYIRQQRALSN